MRHIQSVSHCFDDLEGWLRSPQPVQRKANVPGLEDDIVLMEEAVVVRRMELEMRVRSMYLRRLVLL